MSAPTYLRISSSECVAAISSAAPRRIDAVETRRHGRRTADAQVHFGGAGGPHHLDDLAAGGAAHQRIVDQHDALAREDALHRIELHLHAEMPDRLRRLDERAADIVIADQPEAQRNLGLFRIANRRADTRVGNRHDHVGVDAGFARQLAAEIGAHFVDALAEHFAVGPREIHVLEDAVRQRRVRERLDRSQAMRADDQDLARLDVAHVGGADQVERAGFEVTAQASPSRPSASGRKPCGSRTAIRLSLVISANEKAPVSWVIASTSASSIEPACDRA